MARALRKKKSMLHVFFKKQEVVAAVGRREHSPQLAEQWDSTATASGNHLALSNEAEDTRIPYIAIQVPRFI